MSERFSPLYSLPNYLFSPGVPVMISAGTLFKDSKTNKVFAQFRLQNVSSNFQTITAVKISITSYSPAGNVLGEPKEHQYLDLNIKRGEEFGNKLPIYLDDATTRSFDVTITEVVFLEGNPWFGSSSDWKSLGSPKKLEDALGTELANQYRRDTFDNAKYEPFSNNGIWICACGSLNNTDESNCCLCLSNKSKLFLALDHNTLAAHLGEHLKVQKQVEIEEKKVKKSRLLKKFITGMILVVGFLGASFGINYLIDAPKKDALREQLINGIYWEWYDTYTIRDVTYYEGYRIEFIDHETCIIAKHDPTSYSSYMRGTNYNYHIGNVSLDEAKLTIDDKKYTIHFDKEWAQLGIIEIDFINDEHGNYYH